MGERSMKINCETSHQKAGVLKRRLWNLSFYVVLFIFWISYLAFINEWEELPILVRLGPIINLGIYLIPLWMAVIVIRFVISKKNKKNVLHFLTYLTAFLIHMGGIGYTFHFYECSGYVPIMQKEKINNNYYVYVQDGVGNPIQLKCEETWYGEMNLNDELAYRMDYRYNSLTNKGQVMYLLVSDTKVVPNTNVGYE